MNFIQLEVLIGFGMGAFAFYFVRDLLPPIKRVFFK